MLLKLRKSVIIMFSFQAVLLLVHKIDLLVIGSSSIGKKTFYVLLSFRLDFGYNEEKRLVVCVTKH